jgi:hypothetical protein
MSGPVVSRRRFVQGVCVGAGCLALAGYSRRGFAAWGDIPATIWPASGVPTPRKVLEIHLYGGLSPWETFYLRDMTGGGGWRGFAPGGATEDFGDVVWNALAVCGTAPSPAAQTQAFDNSDPAHPLLLGPATQPLWAPAIRNRMRVIVQAHDLLPHEAAIPYALSGFRLGNPKLAGLGAPIQRRAMELDPARPVPFSYVCQPATLSFPGDNLQAMTATGMHDGASRPVLLKIGAAGDLNALLGRSGMTAEADRLAEQYREQYRDWMRFGGSGPPLRSKGFGDYASSLQSILHAADLQGVLTGAPLALRNDPLCASVGGSGTAALDNVPGTSLRVAASLLSHPTSPASYVCVTDSGLRTASGGGGYDTHSSNHVLDVAVNLRNTLGTLAELITAGSIDLDQTLVVLTTEFGRTPARNGNGRDHWPEGYVNVLIGGPITTSGVVGRINDADGRATLAYNPSDIRAAVLMAAGIYPFAEGLFRLGDISSSLRAPASEEQTARNIRTTLLGIAG